ncbi:MAG TPA: NAD-dependent epimerase/dehydratase family protein [Gaiella sp.]
MGVVTSGVAVPTQNLEPQRGRSLLAPVVITAASGWLGTTLHARLGASSLEVRNVDRPGDLAVACRDASAVVHLEDGVLSGAARRSTARTIFETAEAVVDGVAGSAVERLVFISNVGASPRARTDYLRATANAEACLHACRRDMVIFRCTHVFGPPDDPGETVEALRADGRQRVVVIGSGGQRVAPVYRDDVVDAIVAALDPRNYHGRFDLPGPEEMRLDQFARAVNREAVAIRHVPRQAARLMRSTAHLRHELIDLLAMDSVGEQARAARTFGLVRRAVSDVYWADGSDSSSSPSASA